MNLLFTLLLFESVSGGELILVLLAVFLLFGPNKIPEIVKGLAKGINDIKKATGDIQEEVNKTMEPIRRELQDSVDKVNEENKTAKPVETSIDKASSDNAEEKKNELAG